MATGPFLARSLLFGLTFALAGGASFDGHAEALQRVGGELHPVGTPPAAAFDSIGSDVLGSFVVESAGPGDLRTTPGTVTFTTPGGSLTAEARGTNGTNVDPVSGRARRAGAAGECDSPDDPACLGVVGNPASPSGNWFTDLDNDGLPDRAPAPPLDPAPVLVPPAHAADLAANRPGNAAAFAALCDFTQGSVSDLDATRCLLDFLNNQGFFPPFRAVQFFGGSFAGSPIVATALPIAVTAGIPVPLIRLNNDANDDPLGIDGGVLPPQLPGIGNQAAGQVLTTPQEAIAGCGPFHGSDCDDDGAGLLDSELTALLQSWPISGEISADWRMDFGDPNLDVDDDGIFGENPDGTLRDLGDAQAMPGTVGFAGESPCLREQAGTIFVLPGCRGPFYDAGTLTAPGGPLEGLAVVGSWDPLVDGCVDPTSSPPCAGARRLVIPDLDLDLDGISGDFGASTGQAFVSEMAAFSWNTLLSFAALSSIPAPVVRPPLPDEFDTFNAPGGPGLSPGDPGYDPATMGPLRLDGCSFLRPQRCRLVAALGSHAATELDDDPSGPPQRRWLWETGAEYEVTEASGDLAGFAGWTLHAMGPERSRVAGSDAGVAFLLAPTDAMSAPPDSPLVRRNPGPDGVLGTADDFVLGAAYGVVVSAREVEIDIKPGNDVNPVNPRSHGVIPVAILGSESFDVAEVDVTTLAFGPAGAPVAHRRGPHRGDVNHDGIPDLLAHFRTQETGIAPGDTQACLTGELLDGTRFEGCDAVRTVPSH